MTGSNPSRTTSFNMRHYANRKSDGLQTSVFRDSISRCRTSLRRVNRQGVGGVAKEMEANGLAFGMSALRQFWEVNRRGLRHALETRWLRKECGSCSLLPANVR